VLNGIFWVLTGWLTKSPPELREMLAEAVRNTARPGPVRDAQPLCLSQTYWLAVDRESGDADL
jgi:hypothetical protein